MKHNLAPVYIQLVVTLWSLTFALGVSANSFVEDPNVFIRMRDGTNLAADIYMPLSAGKQPVPVIMIRTPYSKDRYSDEKWKSTKFGARLGPELVEFFTANGFAVAVQDKRGRFRSDGLYIPSIGDANDGYDTVDWLSKQPWSNGRIGAIGCSYEGDIQIFLAGAKPPALKAIIPQASGSAVGSLGGNYRYFGVRVGGSAEWAAAIGWFSDAGEKNFPKLSTRLPHNEYNKLASIWDIVRAPTPIDDREAWMHLPMKDALSSQGMPPTDFEDTMTRPVTDPYWAKLPYMTNAYTSDVPALFINSWYDFGADMTLTEFNHFRQHSISQNARENQYFIMSPHSHCNFEAGAAEHTKIGERDVGDTRFDYKNAYLAWFNAWLKEDKQARETVRAWPKLRYYSIGRDRWQSASDWPLPKTVETTFWLSSKTAANSLSGDGRLVPTRDSVSEAAEDTFAYDPANPVPSRGGAMCCTHTIDSLPGALDQRSVESRTDVLVYTSDTLASDLDVTGIPHVLLNVSSSTVDTDFTAKLVDVFPDGVAFNVLEGILRARYREGQEKEVWMKPHEHYSLTVPLGATSTVFLRGHRIRLEVSSSNFPRFERNLNVGGNNMEQITWVEAHNTVHHSRQLPSALVLPVVPNNR